MINCCYKLSSAQDIMCRVKKKTWPLVTMNNCFLLFFAGLHNLGSKHLTLNPSLSWETWKPSTARVANWPGKKKQKPAWSALGPLPSGFLCRNPLSVAAWHGENDCLPTSVTQAAIIGRGAKPIKKLATVQEFYRDGKERAVPVKLKNRRQVHYSNVQIA